MARINVDFGRVGPGTPTGRWLRRFWQPVYRAASLEPGWAKRIEIMGEHFTLYRGESGTVHLVEDRCPHRKTQLSTGWIEGDDLRCFYHGWKFAGDGTCLEQPTEIESFKKKACIRSYPVREYLGLIFAYLGDGAPPDFYQFPELEEDNGYPLEVTRTELPYNYFQRVENDLDEAHVHFVHKYSAENTNEFATLPESFGAEETDYGMLRFTTRDRGGKKDVRRKYFLMPNITLTSPPPATELDIWAPHLAWRVPITDVLTISFVVTRRKPRPPRITSRKYTPAQEIVDAILDGRMRMRDVDPYHPRLFFIQDSVACSGVGRLHEDRDSEMLGRSDTAVALLRRIYAREILALQTGRPIKQWRRPAEKLVVGFFPASAAE
jgi:5,5'-dehydrodivanillate O-demethylase